MLIIKRYALLLLIVFALPVEANQAQQIGVLLQERITGLMNTVADRSESLSQDPAAMYNLLAQELQKFVSFTSMARRTMGKHFRRFSREDKNAFLAAFKRNLFNAYIKNFLNAQLLANLPKTYKVSVRGEARFTNSKKTAALQDLVFTNRKTNAEVVATMSVFYSNVKKSWLIRNIIVDGVNLGINYRNQFNTLFVEKKGDMKAIIDAWGAQ